MKIRIRAISSGEDVETEYTSIESALDDLRKGKYNHLLYRGVSWIDDDCNPDEFIIDFRAEDYVEIDIYDYYNE